MWARSNVKFDSFKGGKCKPLSHMEGVMWGGLCLLCVWVSGCPVARSGAGRVEALCQGNKSLWDSAGLWQVLPVLLSARECSRVSPQGPHISFRGN